MRERRFIVNADDFGLHPGINAGILHAHRRGIVTSTSLSPAGTAFEEAARMARGAPALSVGLHLTLVAEVPLTDPRHLPTLAPGGRLPPSFTTLFHRLLLGRVDAGEIARELEAQLARARDAGVKVTHLDSHQHVHLHPAILPLVLRLAARFGIRALRAARHVFPTRGLRPAALALFARSASRRARHAGLHTPDATAGLAETGHLDTPALLRIVGELRAGTTELVCHPGQGDAAIARTYPWRFRWERETAALTDPRVREALTARGVRLISFGEL